MLFLLFVGFLSCLLNPVWTATPYKDCGSELATIQEFVVNGCTAAPCKLIKGNTYSMNLTFQAKAPSKTASVSIHGVIAGIPVPFPLPESNACKLNCQCPIQQNDVNIASLSLAVLPSYPSISLYVKIEIIADDQKHDYTCLEFPVTITSGANAPKLVGWQKSKLLEILSDTKN